MVANFKSGKDSIKSLNNFAWLKVHTYSRDFSILGFHVTSPKLGSLSNGNENVTWKYNFALLLLLRDYSNSFNLHSVGVVSRN